MMTMDDIYAKMRKPMKTFWDLTVDERRALLVLDQQYHVDTPLRSLARMWADCEEDEVLMRLRYADEIALARELFEAEAECEAASQRLQQTFQELGLAERRVETLRDQYADARYWADDRRKTAERLRKDLKNLVMGDR